MNRFGFFVLVVTSASLANAQVGGGSAAYRQQAKSGVEAARANELAKRVAPIDGKFVEASILMNVLADEYVAVFGVNAEGKTLDEARKKMDDTVKAFEAGLNGLKVRPQDRYVDFVAQNRIYGYEALPDNTMREIVVGFEVKKNVLVRYKDKGAIDDLIEAAAKVGVFDLVKVDYVVKDIDAVQSKLLAEAALVLKRKTDDMERLFGVKMGQPSGLTNPQFSIYYPADMYDSYVAQESEQMDGWRPNMLIQRARKPQTFYFNGLTGKDFDHVVNPTVSEPVVQFTVYVRMKY